MTADTFRTRLLATTMICSAFAAPAFAQTATPPAPAQDQPAAPAAEGAADDQLIVVTGTLIRNPNLVSAVPVTVVSEDELNLRQTSVAEDILRQLPGVVPNVGSAVNNGNGGASFVDLRGLGSNRNVVLLDGIRLVPTDLVGRFDLNNIPVALVQRLDTQTGGGSTTYGADAVAGVVNFITKKDFSGLEINASNGITGRGDGNRVRVDLTTGISTDDGRGNAVLSIGYQNFDPIYQGARDVSLFQYDSFSGGIGGSGTTVPSRFSNVNTLGQDSITTDCNVPGQPVAVPGGPNCVTTAQGLRVTTPGGFATGGAFTPFNFNPFNIFQTPFERYNIFGAARYEVADNVEVYTRGIFSKNTVRTIIAPSGAFGISTTINLNNPFLSSAQRNGFCQRDTNTGPGYTPLFTREQCDLAANPALRPNDANYRQVTSTLARRAVEVGPRVSTFTTQFFDYQAGVRGNVTDTIEFDVFGSYGESERTNTQTGYTLNSRVRQSLLAVRNADGTISCINQSGGCVPADFFGPGGAISQDAVGFIAGASSNITTKTSLGQIRATFTGELPIASPFSASNINFAAGAEYREYTASIISDSLSVSGDLGGAGGAQPNVDGGYEVYEGFGELQIPLIEDRPFFKSLNIGGGVRYSSYTIDALGNPGYNTTTWKVESTWEPFDGLRFRGNYQFASRAPNINELFTPVNTTLTNLADDPCASLDDGGEPIDGRGIPTGVLRDVCIAQGASRATIGIIAVPTAGQANTTGGGNIGLQPEDSDSWTVGIVLAPKQIPGLSITVDYYNIIVNNAITSPTPGDAIFACFGPGNLSVSNPSCVGPQGIGRNFDTGSLSGDPATTPGLFQQITNQGRLATDGIDLSVNYTRDIGPVKFGYSFVGSWTRSFTFQSVPGGIDRDCVGQYSVNCSFTGSILPEFQWNQRATFTFADVDLSLLWRYVDGVEYERILPNLPVFFGGTDAPFSGTVAGGPFSGQARNFASIPAYNYFDLSVRFNVTENVSLNLLVENLTDEDPPLVGNTIGATAFNSGNTYPSTYDALGRRFTVAGRVRF